MIPQTIWMFASRFAGPVAGGLFAAIFTPRSHAGFVEKCLMIAGVAFLASRLAQLAYDAYRFPRDGESLM